MNAGLIVANCEKTTMTHRLFNHVSPFRWDPILWIFLKEPAQILQRRSKSSTDLHKRKENNPCEQQPKQIFTHRKTTHI